jgi:hypothetical protein
LFLGLFKGFNSINWPEKLAIAVLFVNESVVKMLKVLSAMVDGSLTIIQVFNSPDTSNPFA